jgi:hypothetical protein
MIGYVESKKNNGEEGTMGMVYMQARHQNSGGIEESMMLMNHPP